MKDADYHITTSQQDLPRLGFPALLLPLAFAFLINGKTWQQDDTSQAGGPWSLTLGRVDDRSQGRDWRVSFRNSLGYIIRLTDYTVLLGDMGTGKTSLVLRFVKGQFFDSQEPTVGAAFFTQILSLSEATVKFDIWDTAGQERYHSLAPMYYRGAAVAVVVYDISSMDTFIRAKKWVQELQRQGNQNLVVALVANKSDLEAKREVQSEEGEQFSQENGMFFIETSAKTSHNINDLFFEIAKRLVKALPAAKPPSAANLHRETRERRRKLFCCSG